MGVINTGTHPALLWPGIFATWGQMYNQHPMEYEDLYEVKTSDKAYERAVQVTGFGLAPIKGQLSPISMDFEAQGAITTYSHIAYALGYVVSYEELRDNLYEEVSRRRAEANAFSISQTVENVCAFLYNNAFTTTYFTTGDGKALIAADHLNATGGTFSNALTPAADLSEASLEDLTIQMMGATNDRGLQISVMPKSLHIHRAEYYNACRILDSTNRSATANNDINVLRTQNVFPGGAKLNHYFNSPGAWFIRTNVPQGMTMFWRDKPSFTQDNDWDTKNAKAATYMRFSVGATDPRGIYGSNGP